MKVMMAVMGLIAAAWGADDAARIAETERLQGEIDAASAQGGGRVVVTAGVHPCGTLYLKSNVELHLEAGAELQGGTSPEDYDDAIPVHEVYSYEGAVPATVTRKAFIYAENATNIAITGTGMINGRGQAFFNQTTWAKPTDTLRPRMVVFMYCRDIRLEDATFKDSPLWTMWLRRCENIVGARIHVDADQRMINSDGIDFDACRNVRLGDSSFSTGDDCLILRAIRHAADTEEAVSENVVVSNCVLSTPCQGVRIACPSDHVIRDAVFRNMTFTGYNAIFADQQSWYLEDGNTGNVTTSNILFEDWTITCTGYPISAVITDGVTLSDFGHMTFRNIEIHSQKPIKICGNATSVVRDITLENITGTIQTSPHLQQSRTENLVVIGTICGGGTGVERLWRGGENLWSNAEAWNPVGVPGTAADDVAAIPATNACVLHVAADVALARINADMLAAGGSVTFDVASGTTLAADVVRPRASNPADYVVTGGGTFALTNAPFGVGYTTEHPSHFTVSGAGTTFVMPKASGSGLYIGATAANRKSVDNVFRVTAGARAVISNATCVGQGYLVDEGTATTGSGGRLLVDDGGSFHGGAILFIGREGLTIATRAEAVICAVTNGTLSADLITLGSNYHTFFAGSNGLVRAQNIELPQVKHAARFQMTAFEDSVFEVSTAFRLLAGGQLNTNAFRRCRLSAPDWVFGTGASWNGVATLDGCEVTGKACYFALNGTSNNVVRFVNSAITVTNNMVVGSESGAKDARVELDGGALACKSVMIGKPGTARCGVRVRGNPTVNVTEWILGDELGQAATRATGPWTEFAETTNTFAKLLVGAGSVNARMLVTNAAVTVRGSNHFVVGRDAGATGNVLRVVQGGVCRYETTTSDFYVGQNAGANGNRLEVDGGTFAYNRRFMAVGFAGSSNVLSLVNGARLEAANSQLWMGYRAGATGNRFVMGGDSVATVRKFGFMNAGVAEFVGAGNVLTVGDEGVSLVDGDAFMFRPSSAAVGTPVVTVNRQLTYGPNRPITVDLTGVGTGVYRLIACAAGVPAVEGVPVTFLGVPETMKAHLSRSSDGKELRVVLAVKGTTVTVR